VNGCSWLFFARWSIQLDRQQDAIGRYYRVTGQIPSTIPTGKEDWSALSGFRKSMASKSVILSNLY